MPCCAILTPWSFASWMGGVKSAQLHQRRTGAFYAGNPVSSRDSEHRHRRKQSDVPVPASYFRGIRGVGTGNYPGAGVLWIADRKGERETTWKAQAGFSP